MGKKKKKRGITNSKYSKKTYSDPVGRILGVFSLSTIVNAKEVIAARNKLLTKKLATKADKKLMAVAIVICLIIAVISIITLIPRNKKEKVEKEKETLYDITYKDMNFKEDKSLKKLECHKSIANENSDVKQEEVKIYYFDGDEIDTYIYHIDIKVTKDYMDYYDAMYKTYDKSLQKDYSYDNVDTNLTKGENELLITVINYNKKSVENKLSPDAYVNYDDAEKSITDSGYICK